TEAIPLAVAVTEPRASDRMDPHAFMREQEPRLIVFGDATWVTNQFMVEGGGFGHYELFASTLSWVRERPDIGKTASPKERAVFVLGGTSDSVSRLYYVPLLFLIVAIVSLGGGIWLVRRR